MEILINFPFRKFVVFVLSCSFAAVFSGDEESSKVVTCELFSFHYWSLGTLKTCYMKNTAVDSLGISFSSPKDNDVGAVDFDGNKNIQFLPENIADSFPSLLMYYAANCAIKSVTKLNFKSLRMLRKLYLYGNQISKIEGDTFDDLTLLEHLQLGEACLNKIPDVL